MKHLMNAPASVALKPQSMTDSATATGPNIDCAGYRHASILISRGPNANTNAGSMLCNLEHSDTTDSTNFATAVAQMSVTKSTAANGVIARYEVDLRKTKRYLRIKVTSGTNGTNDNIVVGASALLSRAEQAPSAESSLADAVTTYV